MLKKNKPLKREPTAPRRGLRLTKFIENIDNGQWQVEIAYDTISQERKRIRVPRLDTPAEIYKKLLSAGAALPERRTAIEQIQRVLSSKRKVIRVTGIRGWNGNSYVTQNWTAGDNQSLRLDGPRDETNPMNCQRGEAAQWKAGLEKPCQYSSYLSFAIGLAFAAPLLKISGEDEGSAFNFHGYTSSGKSLSSRACQSTFGAAGKFDLLNYNITPYAFDEKCAERCDGVFILDEAGLASGSTAEQNNRDREMAFLMAGGTGRQRSTFAEKQGLKNMKWRTLALTTSERPLESLRDRRRLRAPGERIRHIDIKIPDTDQGIFDLLDPDVPSRPLANRIEETIRDHYGCALKPYICWVITNLNAVREWAIAVREDFIANVGVGIAPWERRLASKFGLVLAGMIVGAESGLAPWSEEHARTVVHEVYWNARKTLAATQEQIQDALIKLAQDIGDTTQFPRLEHAQVFTKKMNRMAHGFLRGHPTHGDLVVLNPTHFAERFGTEIDGRAMTTALIDLGIVVKRNDGKRHLQLQVTTPKGKKRLHWLCLSVAKLTAQAQVFKKSRQTNPNGSGSVKQ